MSRPTFSLLLLLTYAALTFGLRTWRHFKSTGSSGFRGLSGRAGSPEWIGGLMFIAAIGLSLSAPVAELGGLVEGLPRHSWVDAISLGSLLIGTCGTWAAQSAMGASWRIGVGESERTELVVGTGPFRWIRNPIFTFMIISSAGFATFLPNVLSLGSVVCLVIAVELQVRFAEEPYLRRIHGDSYDEYCRSVGRFLPGLGRLGRR